MTDESRRETNPAQDGIEIARTTAHGGGAGVSSVTVLTNFALFLLMVIALSIIFTCVFNHTKAAYSWLGCTTAASWI